MVELKNMGKTFDDLRVPNGENLYLRDIVYGRNKEFFVIYCKSSNK